ncbi:MAG: cytochrome c3 family protein, partial [Desulfobacteraceae bacterium]|nr:cytochrome c3 family protein [Desulfobacteraceae bacterium]
MRARTIIFVSALIIFSCAIAVAVQNQGKKDIKIDGGKKGVVNFPHHQHQNQIDDCNKCHDVFPQTPKSIQVLIADGKLKKKQVMNKTCLKCHRTMKKAG